LRFCNGNGILDRHDSTTRNGDTNVDDDDDDPFDCTVTESDDFDVGGTDVDISVIDVDDTFK
jgi:hypothetical protein